MHFEQLEYFIEVVENKSISNAAKKLFISQPALSQSIASFEKEVGAELLKRSRQGIVPTTLGQEVFLQAQDLVNTVQSTMQKWQKIAQENSIVDGEVHLVTIPSANAIFLHQIFEEIKQSYPNINLFFYEALLHTDLKTLEENQASIGIGSYKEFERKALYEQARNNNWVIENLFIDDLKVLISTKNALSQKPQLTRNDLKELPLAYYSNHNPSYLQYFTNPIQFRLNRKENIMQLVAKDEAVAVFPGKLTQYDSYQKKNFIKALPFSDDITLPKIFHYIIHRPHPMLSLAEQKVIKIVKYYFSLLF